MRRDVDRRPRRRARGRWSVVGASLVVAGCFYRDNPAFGDLGSGADQSGSDASATASDTGGSGAGSDGPVDPPDAIVVGIGPCDEPGADRTRLAAAAAGLQPGTWCELSMGNFTWTLIGGDLDAGSHIGWASEAVYDPLARTIRFVGAPLTGDGACLQYDEATDWWDFCILPPDLNDAQGIENNAIDPATGDHYIRAYVDQLFYRWDSEQWRVVPSPTICAQSTVPALTWDAARGGLVVVDGSEVCFFDAATRAWSRDSEIEAESNLHFHATYDERAGVVWLLDGNGFNGHWADDRGMVTPRPDAPTGLGCCGSDSTMVNYDYTTGRFVVFNPFRRQWFDYDLPRDSWREFESDLPVSFSSSGGMGGISVTVSDYGVILYLIDEEPEADPKAFAYRHG